MRKARNWTSLLIMPEADVAFGPLPLSLVEVEVKDGRQIAITGKNFSFQYHLPALGSMNDAVDWVKDDLNQRGFGNPHWLDVDDSSRIYLVENKQNSVPSSIVGLIYRMESEEGDKIFLVGEQQGVLNDSESISTVMSSITHFTRDAVLPIQHPDDAIVHASLHSYANELDLSFQLPAGTVPSHYAFGMIQTERVGRYGSSDYCRFIADGIIAHNGDGTRQLAEEIANDPGVRDARVRMVDSAVAEVTGRIIDKRKKESTLRCRMIPAEEGVGLLIATLTLSGEDHKESKKLLATATETVDTQGAKPRPIPHDVSQNAIDALMVIDSFRNRKISKMK